MQSFFFWNNWPKDYRWLLYALGGIFIFSLVLLWVYYFQGPETVIDWEKVQEQKVVETTVHTFRLGAFQLAIPSESYVIFEYLSGSNIHHSLVATNVFLIVVGLCVVILLALISTLERFWYFGGMSLFILFMVSLRLDVLHLFGTSGYILPISILLIYILTSFYFKYFRTRTSFLLRCLAFFSITLLLTISICFFATVPYPQVHLIVTAYTPALILSTLFIIMVAHEILVSFVYITNHGSSGKNVKHFSLISFIYIINIIITCLHEVGVIDWNFIYVNLFLLITISAILGVWGFKLREPLYEQIFSFSPFGAFFYIALGSICMITIAHTLGNANDATLRIIRYIIIFSHAGFGIIFLMYFFSNFLVMMGNNIPVYNLLYRPNRMPYFTFRFAGIIASLAFLFYSNWRDFVAHGVGGFYNYVGDMHLLQGNDAYAQIFYEQSRNRSFQNHRANYALAVLKSSRLNLEGAAYNYQLANARVPSEFSVVNGSNLSFWNKQYFDAIRSLKQGEKTFPGSGAIKNNLGYAYAKVHSLDTASYYLNEAREHKFTKSSAEANFFAMAATELIPINTDSVLQFFDSQSPVVNSNAIALATLFDQDIKVKTDPLTNTQLDLYAATLLNNYINRNVKNLDTAFIARANAIASDTNNIEYREAIKSSLANSYYHQGKIYKAFEMLGELAYLTQNYQGKFNYVMGLWALEQGAPAKAASSFAYADIANYKNAKFYRAIALTESRQVADAVQAWDSLLRSEDEGIRTLASQLKHTLTIPESEALGLSDAEKYQFCRYRLRLSDSVSRKNMVNSFTDDHYKAQVLLDAAYGFYHADQIGSSVAMLNRISGLELSDQRLYNDLRHLELLLFASRNEIGKLREQMNKDVVFSSEHKLQKLLYTALISKSVNDLETAEKNFEILAKSNPFFEEGILAAASFFRDRDPKSLKPYDILVDAIYLNDNSVRLLEAYAAEASRQGFEEYASSAVQRLMELQAIHR